jgi:hypothetical protein
MDMFCPMKEPAALATLFSAFQAWLTMSNIVKKSKKTRTALKHLTMPKIPDALSVMKEAL